MLYARQIYRSIERALAGHVAGPLCCSLVGHAFLLGGAAAYVFVTPPRLMLGGETAGGGVYEVSMVSELAADGALDLSAAVAELQAETSAVLPQADEVPAVSEKPVLEVANKTRAVPQVVQRDKVSSKKTGQDLPVTSAVHQEQGAGEGARAGLGQGSTNGAYPLASPKPPYPRRARLAGFEGRVEFDLVVGTDGRVRQAELLQSSGRADCDDAARGTLTDRWRFEPAQIGGRPIEWRERVAVVFSLR